jgi:hypothetical protein
VTFTPLDYQIPHAIVVNALRDPDTTDESVIVALTAPGVPPVRVLVNVRDADVARIIATPSLVNVVEGQRSVVRVRLSARPAANVIVSAAAADRQIDVAPTSLVFTPANWDVDQTITVAALHDPDTADGSSRLLLSAPVLEAVAIPVAIQDDDVLRIILEPAALTVREGARAALTARLSGPPLGTVIATVSSQSPLLTVSPTIVTFTPANWSQLQQIAVAALQDDDRVDNTGVVGLFAPGLPLAPVQVSISDDDM